VLITLPSTVIAVETYHFGDSIPLTSLHQSRCELRGCGSSGAAVEWMIMAIRYHRTVEASSAKNG
jgi:hypothetical protein